MKKIVFVFIVLITSFLLMGSALEDNSRIDDFGQNKRINVVTNLKKKYVKVSGFSEGLAIAKTTDGQYDAIDVTGKEIISFGFDWDEVEVFLGGLAKVKKNNKYGLIDKTGNLITPAIYDKIDSFTQAGIARVEKSNIFSNENRKYGYIDQSGEIIIPCEYDDLWSSNGDVLSAKKNGKYGIIDISNNVVIPFEYDDIRFFTEGFVAVKKNERFGFIDINNNIVIPFIYDDAGAFCNGIADVKKAGKWGLIDVKNNVITPFIYDYIGQFNEGMAMVKIGYKYGYIDQNGNEVIPVVFSDAENFNEGFANVKESDGRYGFINKTGEFVIDPNYELLFPFCEGLAIYKYGGVYPSDSTSGEVGDHYGYIDKTGKIVASGFSFRGPLYQFNQGLAVVMLEKKYGVIDNCGEFVIPLEYDKIIPFNDGYAIAEKGNEWFIFQDTMYSDEATVDGTGEPDVTVVVNEEILTFDQPPVIQNDRTLVPLRGIFEAMGAQVDWEEETKTITAQKDETVVTLQVDSDKMYVNGELVILDVPAIVMNDRTLVPLRAISEAFGATVEWEEPFRMAKITS